MPLIMRAHFARRWVLLNEVEFPEREEGDRNSPRREWLKDQTANAVLAIHSTKRIATQTELCPSARMMISTLSMEASSSISDATTNISISVVPFRVEVIMSGDFFEQARCKRIFHGHLPGPQPILRSEFTLLVATLSAPHRSARVYRTHHHSIGDI